MTWIIEGSGQSLYLNIDEDGNPSIAATVTGSDLRLSEDHFDGTIIERLATAEVGWEISPFKALNVGAERLSDEFSARMIRESFRSHYWIRFRERSGLPNSDQPAFVGVQILVPPASFDRVWSLFLEILRTGSLGYRIALNFFGPRKEDEAPEKRTLAEFVQGTPYFGSQVSFSLRRVGIMGSENRFPEY
jgi:hypothetical protein